MVFSVGNIIRRDRILTGKFLRCPVREGTPHTSGASHLRETDIIAYAPELLSHNYKARHTQMDPVVQNGS